MSAKSTMIMRKVKTSTRAKVSNNGSSCHRRREDPAVAAMQEAGDELSCLFNKLKQREVAGDFVKAIRCHDVKEIQSIIGCECHVVCFFNSNDSDCVRICCAFGSHGDVKITFDICVKRIFDACTNQRVY